MPAEKVALQRELQSRLKQHEMVARLGLVLLGGMDIERWMTEVTQDLCATLEVDGAKVLQLDPDGQSFLLRAATGVDPLHVGTYREKSGRASESGFALLQRGPVISEDLRVETRFEVPDILREHGIISTVTTLIGEPDRPYGVLEIDSRVPRKFSGEDVTVLQAVSNLVATAIERRRALDLIAHSEQQQRTLAELSSDYTYLIRIGHDRAPAFEWVSDSLLQQTRFDEGELLREPHRLLSPLEAGRLFDEFRRLEPGQRGQLEHGIVTRDGKVRHVRNFFQRLRGAENDAALVLGAAQDVTDRRVLAEQLQHSQRMESVGRLAGGIAHDFNNLLTVITGYVEVLLAKRSPYDEEWEELTEVKRAAERAASLTRQLLAFGRKQLLRPRVVRINSVVRQVERLLQRAVGASIRLVLELAEEAGEVFADPGQLEQVLLNLAMNARDAMKDGGRLTIRTGIEHVQAQPRHPDGVDAGTYVLLTASDTGHGMTPEVRAKVFEPFFTTKGRATASGLGLASVYGIIAQSGGHIAIDSEPGKGATFRIYIPRCRDGASVAPDRAATVVLVEDDEAVRRLASRVLRAGGFSVLEAGDGVAGLELLLERRDEPMIVITDVTMPGMTGPAMIERARRSCPSVKALYISAHAEHDVAQLLPDGAECITKPFDPRVLLERVRELATSLP